MRAVTTAQNTEAQVESESQSLMQPVSPMPGRCERWEDCRGSGSLGIGHCSVVRIFENDDTALLASICHGMHEHPWPCLLQHDSKHATNPSLSLLARPLCLHPTATPHQHYSSVALFASLMARPFTASDNSNVHCTSSSFLAFTSIQNN